MSKVLYTSPPPRLILAAARLLALKSAASACACAWAAHACLAPHLAAAAAPPALALAAALASPYAKLSLGFGALAALSAAVSRAVTARTVLRLTLEAGGEGLLVATPRLLGAAQREQRVRVADVQGASANSTLQGFRVAAAPAPGGGLRGAAARPFYLFPVEPHWRSEDLPALRRLLFAQYFREEEAAAAAAGVGSFGVSGAALAAGIAGFGPFRPAQFADPRAQGARALEEGSLGSGGAAGEGAGSSLALCALPTGLRLERGTVWADFAVPPAPTLEERRASEAARRAGRAPPPRPLPTLPSSLLPPKD
jgi:hypothetical protein